MKNAYAISSLSRQMVKVCEQIDSLAMGVQDTEQGNVDVADAYTDMLLDEIEHVQMLTLKLTEVITEAAGEYEPANADEAGGSAFSEGELTVEKKPSEDGDDGKPAPEQEPKA